MRELIPLLQTLEKIRPTGWGLFGTAAILFALAELAKAIAVLLEKVGNLLI